MTNKKSKKRNSPKVLFVDIETRPMLAYLWGLYDQNIALNQLVTDWSILSFAAKWQGETKIIYKDLSRAKNIDNDKPLLDALWKLLDEADVVVAQNGVAFDKKKIYARFALHEMPPPAPFKFIDTLLIAKKVFSFTSNKLEYLSDKLNKKYKKLKHEKFSGFEMWRECLAKNPAAWKAMREYNMYDVLALEELYDRLLPWHDGLNFNLYHEHETHTCRCGSEDLVKRGYHYTATGKFQRYCCNDCGSWTRDRVNLFSKEKKASLHMSVPR